MAIDIKRCEEIVEHLDIGCFESDIEYLELLIEDYKRLLKCEKELEEIKNEILNTL